MNGVNDYTLAAEEEGQYSLIRVKHLFLFILGCAGSLCCQPVFSSCGAWASHCRGLLLLQTMGL